MKINPATDFCMCSLLVVGGDRGVLSRDILRRSTFQGRRPWFCLAQGLVSAQRLEHDGLRRRRDRVSRLHLLFPFSAVWALVV